MSFGWPLSFLLLLPLAGAAWRMLRRGRRVGVKFAPIVRLPARTAGWRAALANVAPWIFLLGAGLLIVAAARPRSELSQGRRSVDAIAIAMTVDVSESMKAIDLTPPNAQSYMTRLDVVKDMFRTFIKERPDDLIGLVTFGGYASSRSPLTADHEALLHILKGVEIPRLGYDANGRPIDGEELRTAVGDGLATALARLKDAEPTSKVVILLSDGDSNTGVVTPDEAAEAAAKLGIRVYTIGVGTNSRETPFLDRTVFGESTIAYARTAFDESQLKSIAEKTHARYFAVNDAEGLKAALQEIGSLEKTTLESTTYQRWHEHFKPFLISGVILMLVAVTLQMEASRRLV